MREKRSQWEEFAAAHERDKLVFLDESGINTDMTRRYGRAVGKARVIDHVPCNTPKNTTIVSSMRLDGTCAYDVIDDEWGEILGLCPKHSRPDTETR